MENNDESIVLEDEMDSANEGNFRNRLFLVLLELLETPVVKLRLHTHKRTEEGWSEKTSDLFKELVKKKICRWTFRSMCKLSWILWRKPARIKLGLGRYKWGLQQSSPWIKQNWWWDGLYQCSPHSTTSSWPPDSWSFSRQPLALFWLRSCS